MDYVSPVRNQKALPEGKAIEITVKSGVAFHTTRWYVDGVVDVVRSSESGALISEAMLSELQVGWLVDVAKKEGPAVFKEITHASGIVTPIY